MEEPKKDEKVEQKEESNNRNINNLGTYESYLEKKARNIFVGWQKRYFVCLEGKIIIYTESKENKNVKGFIPIKKINDIKQSEGNTFTIETEGRSYNLRAENQNIKNDWIEKIKYCFTHLKKGALRHNSSSFDSSLIKVLILKGDEKEKINDISQKLLNIINKNGYILNIQFEDSKQYLEKYRINKLINLNDKKMLTHIHFGFMHKKQKFHDTFNKRWFFIFSRSCIKNTETNIDNEYLDEKKQKDWIKFDTLYYFKYDEKKNDSQNSHNVFDAEIQMDECHQLITFEKDGKYFINMDYKERIYEFYCETKIERDEWFEILINSRRTAKTYKFSITKHPKNVEGLYNMYIKDQNSFYEKLKSDIVSCIGDASKISELNIFEFSINNLQSLIESYMDGCICSLPIKIDLLKVYIEFMNKEYLSIYKMFWEKFYDKLSKEDIIKLGLMLLNYYDEVTRFNVEDVNLLKNGIELIKIYYKSIFPNILFSIENMLKYNIEHKGSKDGNGIYYSEGPKILFDIFWKIFDLVKNFKHKIIFSLLLKIFNMSLFQYCFGINCVISNRGIIIEDEYLITVSNDTLIIGEFLNGFIENFKNLNVLTEEEINEEIQLKKIVGTIDRLNYNSIIHLVYEHKDELEKQFEEEKFLKMELNKIIPKASEIYAKYKSMMNERVIKIFYNEVLKLTLCYYITSLLLIHKKKKINKIDVINKIKIDKDMLFSSFKDIIGENLTNITLKILDDIIGILEINKNLISTSILTIRQYIGPAFTYSVCKKLIKLRSDLTKEEKIDCKNQCEEVLNKYEGPKNETSSYFQILNYKIKKNDKDKEYLKIKASQIKFGNQIQNEDQYEDDWGDGNKNKDDNNSDLEEDVSKIGINVADEENCNEMNLEDFMKDIDNDDLDDEDENENEEEEDEIKEDKEEESKADYEGFLYKKSNAIYKKYYYNIKNFGLYWYEDEKSTKPKNKLSLKNIAIQNNDTESNKFSLKLKEKDIEKEYKFKCNTEEEKNNLIKAINKTINLSKLKKESIEIPNIQIKERKKIIKDLFKSNNNMKIKANYIEDKIFECLKSGKFFKINRKKMEKVIKDNKEKKQIEKEKMKEKEKEKTKNKEKKKDKDGKGKQKKSVKTKIKNWFKGKIKGKKDKNEDEK